MDILDKARKEGRETLSEYESKIVLASYHIPVTREIIIQKNNDVISAAHEIGYPVVMKGCSPEITHKTEKGLIRTDIRDDKEALDTFNDIMAGMNGSHGSILIQEMIKGKRELVIGLIRDPQFGPCVMFGLGGIFTEILKDVSFRLAPLEKRDALEMMDEIKAHKILDAVRGMEPVDRELLSEMLINVGKIGVKNDAIKEIDINPVIISGNRPVAVDALIVLQPNE
ncbi:MAG: acetate--CoA ligase family protein [Deltaproteobacteria bacterium]|nr:acetate--CoA ligase family protein [Deltaproteobacteria bacterium]MBW2334344.1 acetate--CoA ligase family protein [Deltaproteobacteria bacterium]